MTKLPTVLLRRSRLSRRTTLGRAAALLCVAAALVPTTGAAAEGDVGYRGLHFSGTGTEVTGAKPESKLWWNDGHWWGVLWNEVEGDNFIYKLNLATQTWTSTGVVVDTRSGTRSDALWDGTKLYIASHGFTNSPATGFQARLYRFSYDTATDTYTRDSGFPVAISDWKSEALVIDKDSTGRLWATWVGSSSVYITHTVGDDKTWAAPFVLPVAGATSLNADDISSLIAFGGNKIGVMWSHQNHSAMYFAVHVDGLPPNVWESSRTAIQGPNEADDHINLKSMQSDGSGRVYAAVKTNHTASSSPYIRLMVRDPVTGDWASHTFGRHVDRHTRPIVLLDETNRMIYMFATSGESGGTIYMKTTSMDDIQFAQGLGQPFIRDAASADMNDATSTKQNVSATTGLVVLASNDSTRYYWHNYLSLGTAPPLLAADFTASPTSGATPLDVAFTDTSTGSPTSWSWNFGDGTTSTEQHPRHTYLVGGTYTVTLTVTNAAGDTSTKTRTEYITATSPSDLTADFTATPTSGVAPLEVALADTSSGVPTSWSWNFGDGGTSTDQHPTHTYASAGTYSVTLTVTDALGASSTKTRTNYISVAAPLAAAFTGTPTSGYAPLAVAFTDQSTGSPTSWSWDFGDGASSTAQSPTHTYSAEGTYSVTLTVRDAAGGSSTTTKTAYITVSPPPSTLQFTPVADAYTKSDKPSTNYGTATTLRVKNGGTSSTAYHQKSYLRFDVSGVAGTVTSAKLRFYVNDPASNGGTVYTTVNAWGETTITWGNQPAAGSLLATVGAATLNTWIEITIPAGVFASGNGTYSFVIQSNSASDGTSWYSSREGANPPQLLLTS
jgi:PKD repeat protein